MAKIKLTKNELKKQKDALKRYTRYLPTLELKKQQLLAEIRRVNDEIRESQGKLDALRKQLSAWVALFAEDVDVASLLKLKEVVTDTGNIAGINIPLFKKLEFEEISYDLMKYPLWVDSGVIAAKDTIAFEKELDILREQEALIQEELRTTVQRINLFDKVMIPRSKENIRKIRIFMGDQDTAAVVRGKISKSKIEKKKLEQSA
ncbi:MAG: V-type ATP synthase subunit D [Candidatus Marinimicrobia bacterium]|nr:V-type ATP synthase subunit D [Candidatus Neomarinimicrobiota bacterium]